MVPIYSWAFGRVVCLNVIQSDDYFMVQHLDKRYKDDYLRGGSMVLCSKGKLLRMQPKLHIG